MAVRNTFGTPCPACALILGSGWGEVAQSFLIRESLSYADIPHLGLPEVEGHCGCLYLAEFSGLEIFIFQGRRHWYEGAGWEPVAIPIYLSKNFGVSVTILTNAAGGIRDDLKPGDLMVIDDHINAMGVNPLVGNHGPTWGPRFPDQQQVYDACLRKLLDKAGSKIGEKMLHGVYLATSGPMFETPAEIVAFRSMGADAVGMSTVPEAILANAAGMRVAGISCITNLAAGMGSQRLSHKQTVEVAHNVQQKIKALLMEFFAKLAISIGDDAS